MRTVRYRYDRGWAYLTTILGAVTSLAANVAAIYIPPAGASPTWRPQAGAVLSAVFWPLALLLALEVNARFTWPEGGKSLALRWLGLTPVTAVAAAVSYQHMHDLLASYHSGTVEVWAGPLAVDGLMVISQAALTVRAQVSKETVETPIISEPVAEPERQEEPTVGAEAVSEPLKATRRRSRPKAVPDTDEMLRDRIKAAEIEVSAYAIRGLLGVGMKKAQRLRDALLAERRVSPVDDVGGVDGLPLHDGAAVGGGDHFPRPEEDADVVAVGA